MAVRQTSRPCPGRPLLGATAARVAALLVPLVIAAPRPALAHPESLSAFIAQYPTAYALFTCGTCHLDFAGPADDDVVVAADGDGVGGARNAYGRAFGEAHGQDQPQAAFLAIEGRDSDGDGTPNGIEILTATGFHPGYRCDTFDSAVNAPSDLAFYVDPSEPGCGLLGTTTMPTESSTTTTTQLPVESSTTTLPETTTTTDTTTTTLAQADRCARPLSDGATPVASDCLIVLRAAVGSAVCSPECICAPKGSLPTTASDALLCLKATVGQDVTLQCPCDVEPTTTTSTTTTLPTTTTTLPATTTTSTTTTTTLGPTTTTTLPPPTTTTTTTTTTSTTTTLPPTTTTTTTTTTTSSTTTTTTTTTTLPPPTTTTTTSSTTTTTVDTAAQRGMQIYDQRCASCHRAGSYDTKGNAPDLANKGALLVNDLGTIDPAMNKLTLTNQEISDLSAFLNGL